MFTDDDKVNGLPIRAEIRVPRDIEAGTTWLTSVVVCQDIQKGSFVVWSVFDTEGRVQAENGIYDIASYGRALGKAMDRVSGRLV